MNLLAYYVHDLDPFLIRFGNGLGIRWYGTAYALGFICCWWLYRWLARRGYSELRPEQVADFITWAAACGVILGGRLGYMLLYSWPAWRADPALVFRVWEGGMASHGGMAALLLFTWWYARRHRVAWAGLADNLCVVGPVGLCFGRIANFIIGELYGKPATVPWAVVFPGDPLPRHPSQLYEAALEGAVLFAVLWAVRLRVPMPRGVLAGLFFILYAIARIAGEIFREPDPAWAVGRLSAGQFLSLFLVAVGAAFIAWAIRHPTYETRWRRPAAGRRPSSDQPPSAKQ